MGFRYRKSVNLGKGFRVNMSKSGPGFSWGGKGFRLTRTANGNIRGTLSLPGTGMSYQKNFGNPTKNFQKNTGAKATKKAESTPINENSTSFHNDLGSLQSSQMGENSAAFSKNKTNKIIAGFLVLAGIGLGFFKPYFLVLVVFGIVFYLLTRKNETIQIDYNMTDDAKQELEVTNKLLAGIMESDEIWLVTEAENYGEDDPADMKIINRLPLSFSKGNDEIQTNVETYTLDGGHIKFIFLPDSIFIKEGGKVRGLGLGEIQVNLAKMTFLEEGRIPADATVLGKTYQHTNKDGGPDRRYKNNPELTMVEYGILSLYKEPGLDSLIVFSDTVLDGK